MEAISTVARGVGHEIANPLNVIMNYAELMPRFVDRGDRVSDFSCEILKECQRLSNNAVGLISFARESSVGDRPATIQDLINDASLLMGKVLSKEQILLSLDVSQDLPAITCHPQQIQHVLINLMINARDALALKHKGYHEDKIIEISARSVERGGRIWVRVTVKDRGVGIPQEALDHIFEPFTTTIEGRTGLGLTACRSIVERHGGSIHVETEPGEWTALSLYLPTMPS
jgi:signal transduction histidine kinase